MKLFEVIDAITEKVADPDIAAADISIGGECAFGGKHLIWWENGATWSVDQYGNIVLLDSEGNFDVPASDRYKLVWTGEVDQ